MNRSEVAVSVLGLVATFLMPWPGQESSTRADPPAVRAQAEPAACVSKPTVAVDAGHAVAPARTVSERHPDRG